MRRIRCICGRMAEVYDWNSKGVCIQCPECGGWDATRDELYHMGIVDRMTLAFIEGYRKAWEADARNEEIADEAYKDACRMAANMVEDMWESRKRALEEWADPDREEVEYL